MTTQHVTKFIEYKNRMECISCDNVCSSNKSNPQRAYLCSIGVQMVYIHVNDLNAIERKGFGEI